jgi:hypothetical protein
MRKVENASTLVIAVSRSEIVFGQPRKERSGKR